MFLFFFNIQNTQGGQIADMCVRRGGAVWGGGEEEEEGVRQWDSCILSCPAMQKLHIVYLKNTEHFSTIKKHVI